MIGRMVRAVWRVCVDKAGATMVEYTLLIMAIAVVATVLVSALGARFSEAYMTASGGMP